MAPDKVGETSKGPIMKAISSMLRTGLQHEGSSGRLGEAGIETLRHGVTSSDVYSRFRNTILILCVPWMKDGQRDQR